MTRVTYLSHSGFAVTTDRAVLVFDYHRDPARALNKILNQNPDLPVIFFVSHYRDEHFNHSIFEMAQNHRRTYVVSNDVPAKKIPTTLNVAGMSHGDIIDNLPGDIMVKAYGSTSDGVSYLVTLSDGERIFHAGTLNDLTGSANLSESQARQADEKYRTIVNRIAAETPEIDIAMLPVDIRMGDDYARGAQIFLNVINVRDFFPMHFDGDYHKACDFADYAPERTECHCLHEPGESIKLEHAVEA